MANIAKWSSQKRLVFGLFILGIIGIAILVRWGWRNDENVQRLFLTSTALASQTNIRGTELANAELQKAELENQSQRALARQLAAQAQLLSSPQTSQQETALLLAIKSLQLFPTMDATDVIYNSKLAYVVSHVKHGGEVNFVGFSRDSKYLVSTGEHDNTVVVSDVETGKEVAHVVHDYGAWAAAISPDGKHAVSGGVDRTVRVWEIKTGKQISTMQHDDIVWTVAFSPDGKYVISSSEDKTTRIWETQTGKEVARLSREDAAPSVVFGPDSRLVFDNATSVSGDFPGHEFIRVTHDIFISAISPNGKYIISKHCDKFDPSTACGQSSVYVFEAVTGKEVAHMLLDGGVTSIVFSPNSRYFATGTYNRPPTTYNGLAQVWATETGKEISRMVHDGPVSSVNFTPDGKYVISGGGMTVRMWDMLSGQEVARMITDRGVSSVAFSPNGKYIASAEGLEARVWRLDNRLEVAHKEHGSKVTCIDAQGKYVASGSEDGFARVWEIETGKQISRVKHDRGVGSISLSPDAKYVVSSSYNGIALVWEAATGKEVLSITFKPDIRSVAFSADGKNVVSLIGANTVLVWEALTGKEISRMTHEGGATVAVFSPDGQRVLSAGCDITGADNVCLQGSACVWDAQTGKVLSRMTHIYMMKTIAFSPDGKYVISGVDHTAIVWVVDTGQEIASLIHDDGPVYDVAFSPDGNYVITAGGRIVYVWDAKTGKEIKHLEHPDLVASAGTSSDGRYMVTFEPNHAAIHVWDFLTGQEIARLNPERGVLSVSFSFDNKYLIIQDRKNTISVWKYRPEDLIADACQRVTRNLTLEEWNQFIGTVLLRKAICPNLPLERELLSYYIVFPTPIPNETLNP